MGARNFPISVTRSGQRKDIFRSPRRTRLQDIRNEMCLELEKRRHSDRAPASRSGDGWPGGDRHSLRAAEKRWATTCSTTSTSSATSLKKHNKTVTFMPKPLFRRQRLRHAHSHFALERRQAALCRQWLRRAERDGAVLHRRNFETRTSSDLRSRIRQPTVTNASVPDLKRRSISLIPRGTVRPRSASRLTRRIRKRSGSSFAPRMPRRIRTWPFRVAPRGPRWHPEPDRSRRSAGQESLRAATRRIGQRARASRIRLGGAIAALEKRPCVPSPRRRFQCRFHQQLDRDETEGIRRAPAPPAPVRIPDVLRRLTGSAGSKPN